MFGEKKEKKRIVEFLLYWKSVVSLFYWWEEKYVQELLYERKVIEKIQDMGPMLRWSNRKEKNWFMAYKIGMESLVFLFGFRI